MHDAHHARLEVRVPTPARNPRVRHSPVWYCTRAGVRDARGGRLLARGAAPSALAPRMTACTRCLHSRVRACTGIESWSSDCQLRTFINGISHASLFDCGCCGTYASCSHKRRLWVPAAVPTVQRVGRPYGSSAGQDCTRLGVRRAWIDGRRELVRDFASNSCKGHSGRTRFLGRFAAATCGQQPKWPRLQYLVRLLHWRIVLLDRCLVWRPLCLRRPASGLQSVCN